MFHRGHPCGYPQGRFRPIFAQAVCIFVSDLLGGIVQWFSCLGSQPSFLLTKHYLRNHAEHTFIHLYKYVTIPKKILKPTFSASIFLLAIKTCSPGFPYPTMHGQRPPSASPWPWAWAAWPCPRLLQPLPRRGRGCQGETVRLAASDGDVKRISQWMWRRQSQINDDQ